MGDTLIGAGLIAILTYGIVRSFAVTAEPAARQIARAVRAAAAAIVSRAGGGRAPSHPESASKEQPD
ncbi:hypothetical protein KGQ20_02190 [Catenulispora sp. NF23]|uniref:Uncharacterized protein n=1 Tax=Catenulispora pinistramenti TaxID=2705254 RepID=A0ABS5KJQ0_9ACTN|nr:hypothetical protein [Catenulispora pinistramenti]MBS2531575.1 hypothetical protein [Catenulispora pinistramenti]MBS2546175.1 hypothetical protein [Catenulispora pinistramenti]